MAGCAPGCCASAPIPKQQGTRSRADSHFCQNRGRSSAEAALAKLPARRAATAAQTGARYINHLREASAKAGCWKEDVS